MTYQAQENSVRGGQPVELYLFSYADQEQRYTGADADQVYADEVYRSVPISRTPVSTGGNGDGNSIEVTVPRDNEVAALFRVFVPGATVWLTIFRMHLTDGASEVVTYWKGRVRSVKWRGALAIISCEHAHTILARDGLRRPYASMCPHMLYDAACGVPQGAYMTMINGAQITAAGDQLSANVLALQADGYYTAGYVVRNSLDFRMIVSHVGTTIRVAQPFEQVLDSDEFAVFAGCDKALATCRDKFNNLLNYGGFNYISNKNPFQVGLEG